MSDPKRPSFRAFIRRPNPGKGNESSSDSMGTPASTPPVSQDRLPADLPSASASSMSVPSVNVAVTKNPLPENVSVGCSALMAEHGDTISTTDYECKDQQVRFQQLWKEAIDNAKASKDGGKLSEVIRVQEQASVEDAEITLPALIKRLETEMKRFDTRKRLAEAMERIVPHLNRFAVVGDIAVSTNPNPAALPWAANLTAGEEIRGKVVEGIAEITVQVFECSVYHELYLASPASTDLPINTTLRQTIIDALSHCVRFLRFALRRQQAAAKAFTDVFRLEDFTGYLKDLLVSKDRLHDASSLCEMHHSSQSRDQLRSLHDLMVDMRLESREEEKVQSQLRDLLIDPKDCFDHIYHQHDSFCLEGTRVQVLDDIEQWAHNPSSPTICWLPGLAGTGKSTISRTISRNLKTKSLGASFFFKKELDIMGHFANEPLHREVVLHKLQVGTIESDFRVYLRQAMESFVVEYNRTHHQKHLQLSSDWPGEERFQLLLHKALPLFIAAATFVRMICDRHWAKSPDYKIDLIIDKSSRVNSAYETLYKPVLSLILSGAPDEDQDEVKKRFVDIIGSLVLLANPLSIFPLAKLLGVDTWSISSQVDPLRSVIDVPEDDSPLQLHHLSFRDYILSQSAGNLQVSETETQARLASRCLGLMRGTLKVDICGLLSPGKSHSDIEPSTVDEHLSVEIQRIHDDDDAYSFLQSFFTNWLEVLCLLRRVDDSLRMLQELQSVVDEASGPQVLQYIQDAIQFIRYFRAGIEETPLQIYHSETIFSPRASIAPTPLEDRHYPDYIMQPSNIDPNWPQSQTLQVLDERLSQMAFLPDNKLASIRHLGELRIWDQRSCSRLHSLSHGFKRGVITILAWYNSRIIAVGWPDMIKIWNLDSGACVRSFPLTRCSGTETIAFSDDRNWGKVKIWGMESAICKEELEPEVHLETQTFIAAASGAPVFAILKDTAVEIWDTNPLRHVNTFERTFSCLGERYYCLAISANGERLAVGSSEPGTVEIWDVKNAVLRQTLEVPLANFPCIAFSPDAAKIAYTLWETIEDPAWVMRKGERILWLPPDYRPGSVYMSGTAMVLGTFSGHVLFLYLKE
ncbi:Vegetative incompatibility protein HET-E-1 [Fusarium odoratissimum]|uniref:Vegetative incompatibility protein HET-E-1 n=1 Tax=Fusarium oxysporum f. sp. cubense (strain race 4) TaxID=2502994 RepID=N1S1F4_FUSC4|nr:Vegetative incompatibility protein HET-E-1 [Fusarium odoratissimum]